MFNAKRQSCPGITFPESIIDKRVVSASQPVEGSPFRTDFDSRSRLRRGSRNGRDRAEIACKEEENTE